MTKVYVLELMRGNYYIGITANLSLRMCEHFSGEGAKWTKLHRPIKIVETFDGDEILEEMVTLEYMKRYGWKRVRGSCWCQIDLDKLDKFDRLVKLPSFIMKDVAN